MQTTPPPRMWVIIVMLLVALACTCGIYKWSDSRCRDRGGHTELIYGGRGAWVCDGAER